MHHPDRRSSAMEALPLRRPRRSPRLTIGVLAAATGLFVLSGSALAGQPAAADASSGTVTLGWQALTNPTPFDPGAMLLMTDGTVMVQDLGANAGGSPNWWRLT